MNFQENDHWEYGQLALLLGNYLFWGILLQKEPIHYWVKLEWYWSEKIMLKIEIFLLDVQKVARLDICKGVDEEEVVRIE